MATDKEKFDEIVDNFCALNKDVHLGKMMSSPGLKCNDKVFAFYSNGSMGFRLGPEFDPKSIKLKKVSLLNPFKTKGPLKGWYVVDSEETEKWSKLAELALGFTRTLNK